MALFSKNLHHAETSWLTFIECQMTDLWTKQDLTERNPRTDLKIMRNVVPFEKDKIRNG